MKGGGGVALVIGIGLVLFLVIVVSLVWLGSEQGWFSPDPVADDFTDNLTMELFLRGVDQASGEQIETNYVLDYDNGIVVSSGVLPADAYTPVRVDPQYLYHARCWSDENYVVKANKIFTGEELRLNKSKLDCLMVNQGLMTVSHAGDLSRRLNVVTLNLTSTNGWFYRAGICFSWSAGIIDVENRNDVVVCEYGTWKNWSSFDATNQSYNYLPEGTYRCGEDRLETCDSVKANKCTAPQMETPRRFAGTVDRCSYLGKTFEPNESVEIELEISTLDNKNALDEVWVYVFDFDRLGPNGEWVSELNGKDVASPDIKYKIPYKKD